MTNYLDFERPLAEIEGKAEELRAMARQNAEMDIEAEAAALDKKAADLLVSLYKDLSPWRKCQVARHPDRPHCRDYIEALFTNTLDPQQHPYFREIADLKVSAHLLLRRDGALLQFVPLTRRAWHAGDSKFRGRSCCNDYSIGIELEGTDDEAYTDQQYQRLPVLIHAIIRAYPQISARQIAGHCDIAPGRKSDPGPAFDWLRLYDGLAANSSPGKST